MANLRHHLDKLPTSLSQCVNLYIKLYFIVCQIVIIIVVVVICALSA